MLGQLIEVKHVRPWNFTIRWKGRVDSRWFENLERHVWIKTAEKIKFLLLFIHISTSVVKLTFPKRCWVSRRYIRLGYGQDSEEADWRFPSLLNPRSFRRIRSGLALSCIRIIVSHFTRFKLCWSRTLCIHRFPLVENPIVKFSCESYRNGG